MQMNARNTRHSLNPVSLAAFGRKLPNVRCCVRACVRFRMNAKIGYSGTAYPGEDGPKMEGFFFGKHFHCPLYGEKAGFGPKAAARPVMGVFLGRTLGP